MCSAIAQLVEVIPEHNKAEREAVCAFALGVMREKVSGLVKCSEDEKVE
jgi:hypothetical protein